MVFSTMNQIHGGTPHHITVQELVHYYTADIDNDRVISTEERDIGIRNAGKFLTLLFAIDPAILADDRISKDELEQVQTRGVFVDDIYEKRCRNEARCTVPSGSGPEQHTTAVCELVSRYTASGTLIPTARGRELMDEARQLLARSGFVDSGSTR